MISIEQLNHLDLGYIHCVEGVTMGPRDIPVDFSFLKLRKLFKSLYIGNNGYDIQLAVKARQDNAVDLVCFGRPFIGNPDLVKRLYEGAELVEAPKETWYGGGAKVIQIGLRYNGFLMLLKVLYRITAL